jgi:uncharacterized protein YcfJ
MKYTFTALAASAACGLLILGASPADAKGCLKGAVVGGVAGHMAGHGVLGAAGGCAVGHHMANKAARTNSSEQNQQRADQTHY